MEENSLIYLFFEAAQAKLVYKYKSIKQKLIKANLNIRFNKKCLYENITCNYIRVNITNTSSLAFVAQKLAQKVWMKEEIKRLYAKKVKLNNKLYHLHLEVLNKIHPAIVHKVLSCVEAKICNIISKIISTQKIKFNKLKRKQHQNDHIYT